MKTQEEVQAAMTVALPILCALLANPARTVPRTETDREFLVAEALELSDELIGQLQEME